MVAYSLLEVEVASSGQPSGQQKFGMPPTSGQPSGQQTIGFPPTSGQPIGPPNYGMPPTSGQPSPLVGGMPNFC
jgi:hypothetical protein